MSEIICQLSVGQEVKVKIANVYEFGTVTGIEENAVLIQLKNEPNLTREVSFDDFLELGYELAT